MYSIPVHIHRILHPFVVLRSSLCQYVAFRSSFLAFLHRSAVVTDRSKKPLFVLIAWSINPSLMLFFFSLSGSLSLSLSTDGKPYRTLRKEVPDCRFMVRSSSHRSILEPSEPCWCRCPVSLSVISVSALVMDPPSFPVGDLLSALLWLVLLESIDDEEENRGMVVVVVVFSVAVADTGVADDVSPKCVL